MYKNILLKLSGESLMSDSENINKEKTLEIANLIKRVHDMGVNIGIVVGVFWGVIIGNDLQYRDGKIVTNQSAISDSDNTSGIRKCRDKVQADKFIRNTYRVLLSRGMKGCFIYCEDEALRNYLKELINKR